MAVVYTTPDGMIKCHGTQEWADTIITACGDKLMENLTNMEMAGEEIKARATLLRLPKPASKLNSKTLQTIIPKAMKNLQGGGYIKWGHPSAKPTWWPEDVVFANVKQRPVEQNEGTSWVECLRKILSAMFCHHGYDPETYIVTEENSDEEVSDSGDESDVSDGSGQTASVFGEAAYDHDLITASPTSRFTEGMPVTSAAMRRTSTPINGHIPASPHLASPHSKTLASGNSPTTPKLPIYHCGKRNWPREAIDQATTTPKKRKIKPRQVFTPSTYN